MSETRVGASPVVEAVCFDFDGVILESVDVKTQAFRDLFEEYGADVRDKGVRYHLGHMGVSRFDKIRYVHEVLLRKRITEEELREQGEKFSALVLDKVLAAPFVPGAEEFLKGHTEGLRRFVISGTPQDELRAIVKARGLSGCFEGVFGAPDKKRDILTRLLEGGYMAADKALFVGDAMTDYEAAEACCVRFLGRVPDGCENPFPDGTHTIPDLRDLERVIERYI